MVVFLLMLMFLLFSIFVSMTSSKKVNYFIF